ncbi:MAG: Coenzyme A biosynthesis bifunctional protein CoaBC [Firmicutes bacterium ADurb.Bin080]|jgi:phosphopantothenoylcysteine decarboxylase/phosphopantothenate--cysteine ligase|nr:bifunctional phosphopantothenoylcysteine decarboxylase/phosphopantothenate--cysteine ligase CoaBC [Clostridiales bacterium]OQC13314.1 MAG: Coenzyme A biosynthesis bifunctional protein CoaBC [Firmicutes bacterium ADurb.Bin080]
MKKTIVLGVSGCIAAYKSCEIVSRFVKLGYEVRVIMTENATEFVTPLTFETLSMNRVVTSTFDKNREFEVEHISYAKMASVFLIAPATANIIGKIASGIADDMLSTTVLATKAPVYICPAMNTAMYENSAHQENLNKLRKMGYRIIEPSEGRLACGDIGKGKMAEPETIVSLIDSELTPFPDFRGKTVLITAGATEEPIDAVRYITNRSSGKMGVALAEAVQDRGGKVILIAGNISVKYPDVSSIIKVKTTVEMLEAVKIEMAKADIIIKAAAPSDYRIEEIFLQKIKAERLSLNLVKNPDIAKYVGKNKDRKILVVFAAETNDLLENASVKLKEKNADIIVANDVTKEGAGFGSDTNIATIIRKDGVMTSYERMPKRELADLILDNILEIS